MTATLDPSMLEESNGQLRSPGSHGEQASIDFDCNGPRDEPVLVRTQNDIEDPTVALASIGELVRLWIQLLDLGVWRSRLDGTVDIIDATSRRRSGRRSSSDRRAAADVFATFDELRSRAG
jgi:hypothetical protein